MVQLSPMLALVAFFSLSSALPKPGQVSKPHPMACASPNSGKGVASAGGSNVVYFMTNAAKNSVVAMKVAADGSLSTGSITSTGGAGMNGIDQTAGGPAAPDALFSQGAVRVAGNILMAVNPGSNTVSMFTISSTDKTKLTMVGKPVSTMGDFPTSLTISTALNQACVANSGANAGVACFSMNKSTGLSPLAGLRPICLGQTTPPKGPFNTISQVAFNADSTTLITTVKGDPTKNNTGFLALYPISGGSVSQTSTDVSPPGTAVLFGFAALPSPKNTFMVTDASFGATALTLSSTLSTTTLSTTPIAGQAATCWAAFSPATSAALVTDVAVNRLISIDPSTGKILNILNSTNGNSGMIDLATDVKGQFVYALSPGKNTADGAHVAVFDVVKQKEVQNIAVAGAGGASQGMAFA